MWPLDKRGAVRSDEELAESTSNDSASHHDRRPGHSTVSAASAPPNATKPDFTPASNATTSGW